MEIIKPNKNSGTIVSLSPELGSLIKLHESSLNYKEFPDTLKMSPF